MGRVRRHPADRHADTPSVPTITSDVAHGKKAGATPDGRRAGEPSFGGQPDERAGPARLRRQRPGRHGPSGR